MPELGQKPDDWRRGEQRLSARELNQLKDLVLRQITGDNKTIHVKKFGQDRIIISAEGLEGPPASEDTALYTVREEKDDHLVCVRFQYTSSPYTYNAEEGATDENTVLIAKPFLLQKTAFHDKTVTIRETEYTYNYNTRSRREVHYTDEDDVEQLDIETVTPGYFTGDVIRARKGKTSVVVEGERVALTDVNESARSWQPVTRLSDSEVYFAEVDITSGAGQQTSYLCNIFEGDKKSDTNNPHMLTLVEVLQDGTQSFYHGELVVVRKRFGLWYIQKLNDSKLRKRFSIGELGLRLWSATAPVGITNDLKFTRTLTGDSRLKGYSASGTAGNGISTAVFDSPSVTTLTLCDQLVDYRTMLNHFDDNPSVDWSFVLVSSFGSAAAGYLPSDVMVPILETTTIGEILLIKDEQFLDFSDLGTFEYTGTAPDFFLNLFDSFTEDLSPGSLPGGEVTWTVGNPFSYPSPGMPASITDNDTSTVYTFVGYAFGGTAEFTLTGGPIFSIAETRLTTSNIQSNKVTKADFIPYQGVTCTGGTIGTTASYNPSSTFAAGSGIPGTTGTSIVGADLSVSGVSSTASFHN
jgi:hypothetical protein